MIVGAGVIGLFCAVRLAQAGARVTLLEGEKEDFSAHGPAASLAAAGMLAPVSEAMAPEDAHKDVDALALASFDLWRKQDASVTWADAVRFDGAAFIARDEAEASAFVARAAKLGRVVEPLSPGQFRRRTNLEARTDHAFFIADEGVADPGRVLSGLAMAARQYGVQIHFSHDAERIEGNAVHCANGASFEGDVVLLAPGPWANEAMLAAAPALKHITPAKGNMAPVRLDAPLGANVHGPGFYLAERFERDCVLGATMEPGRFDRRADKALIATLFAAAERVLPGQVKANEQAFAWAGVRPMSPDWAPLIGPSGDVLIAAGHSRNGWLLAPITAEIIRAYVYGEAQAPLRAAFTPDRFGTQ